MFQNKPLGSLISSHVGGGTPSRQVADFWNGNIPWASVKDFSDNNGKLERTEEHITAQGLNSSSSSLIKENTIVICSRMAVGKAALTKIPVAINQDLKALFNKKNVNERYLLKLLQWLAVKIESKAVGSTVKGIRISDLLALETPVAPETEQPIIADVLDNLDTKIIQTELLIKKMQLVKEGLLHDLLTRGIGVNGKIRPTFEQAPELYKETQLGFIPKEWEVCLLDNVAKRGSGHTPDKTNPTYWNGGIKWVSLADSNKLDDYYIFETDKEISELGVANSSAVVHKKGTVVLSRDAGIGKSAILGEDMAVSQHFISWSCLPKLSNSYLYFWLQKMKPTFEAIAMGSTIKTIGLPYFKSLYIPLPSLDEQQLIFNVQVQAMSKQKQHECELKKLTELKAGLMDDLLTGRVRVTELLNQKPKAQ